MLLQGRALAKKIRMQLKADLLAWPEELRRPGLDVILVGDDPASEVYVKSKGKACERAGIRSNIHILPESTTQEALHAKLQALNEDDLVDGILLQLPLPGHLDSDLAIQMIDPAKDVDGLHPTNLGRLFAGLPALYPCTPLGCMSLLESIDYDLKGKKAVVVGRSILVGRPVAAMLLKKNATVTICHSHTENLPDVIAQADVVIAAVGKAELVKGEWLKEGAVVIDVGINRIEDGSLVGDVEFATAQERASAITPVPGGVGPMTIAQLLLNTVLAAKRRRNLSV